MLNTSMDEMARDMFVELLLQPPVPLVELGSALVRATPTSVKSALHNVVDTVKWLLAEETSDPALEFEVMRTLQHNCQSANANSSANANANVDVASNSSFLPPANTFAPLRRTSSPASLSSSESSSPFAASSSSPSSELPSPSRNLFAPPPSYSLFGGMRDGAVIAPVFRRAGTPDESSAEVVADEQEYLGEVGPGHGGAAAAAASSSSTSASACATSTTTSTLTATSTATAAAASSCPSRLSYMLLPPLSSSSSSSTSSPLTLSSSASTPTSCLLSSEPGSPMGTPRRRSSRNRVSWSPTCESITVEGEIERLPMHPGVDAHTPRTPSSSFFNLSLFPLVSM